MKVSCLQADLAKGLSIVGRAVAQRAILPVLSNILLATDQGRLKLSATNLEMAITCWIGAKVGEEGATTVPARTFVDLMGAMPAEIVDMALDVRTQTLNLKCGRFENNLRGIDAAEFPLVPSEEDKDSITFIEPDVLKRAISQVAFAASTEESRPILTGVLVNFWNESGEGRVTLAATDGYRLAVRTVSLAQPVAEPKSVIVPARALTELSRIMGDQEHNVHIILRSNQVLFHLDDVELVSQLIDGNFPNYGEIVPKRHDTCAVVGTAELLKACKAANVFARESANIVKLTVTPGNNGTPGNVHVQAVSAETGDNKGDMDATIEGQPIEIAFNVKYMVDVLGTLGTPQVAMETTTAASPGKFTPVGDDGAAVYVVMPMHLGQR